MRFVLPAIVLAIFSGLLGFYRFHSESSLPSSKVIQASHSARTFVAYTNALSAFQIRNPSFVGTVTGTQLADMGSAFSADFLATASNSITAFGSSGKTLIAYAQLQPGALGEIIELTEADASFGKSSGNTWTSVLPGASSQPLSVTAPTGSVVYVVQFGN